MLYTTLLTPFQVDSFDRALSKQLSIHFNHHEDLRPVLLLSLATGLVQASPVTKSVVTDGMPSFPYKRLITMLTSLSRHSQLCLDPRAFGGILLCTGPEGLHLFWLHGCWMQGPLLHEHEKDCQGQEIPWGVPDQGLACCQCQACGKMHLLLSLNRCEELPGCW